ncbi:MAG: hypothetical protein H6908_05735 [Hyphomicrobiales bacterium]|nr:hypothetical protein [Hyphomicrobiales bacterium]
MRGNLYIHIYEDTQAGGYHTTANFTTLEAALRHITQTEQANHPHYQHLRYYATLILRERRNPRMVFLRWQAHEQDIMETAKDTTPTPTIGTENKS